MGGVLDRRYELDLMQGRRRMTIDPRIPTNAGGGGVYSISCMAVVVCMTIDPRTPTMPGRSTSGFLRPGRQCLHQAAKRREVSGELHEGWTLLHIDDGVNGLT